MQHPWKWCRKGLSYVSFSLRTELLILKVLWNVERARLVAVPPPSVPRNASVRDQVSVPPLPMVPSRVDRGSNGGIGVGDDDDDDIYGPPVERRVIRIFPSLAEELREETPVQQDAMPRNQVSFMISSLCTSSSWFCRHAPSLLANQERDKRSRQSSLMDVASRSISL